MVKSLKEFYEKKVRDMCKTSTPVAIKFKRLVPIEKNNKGK